MTDPRSRILSPPDRPLIAPSILAADFARLGEQAAAVLDAGADLLHLDVMDGHFVPNLTMGPDLCRGLREYLPDACLDVHLMVTDPAQFVVPFARAGANHLTFHIEAVPEPTALAREVRDQGMTAGLAINPATDLGAIEPFLEAFDLILVMSVHPGFAGQAFIADVLEKTRLIRPRLHAGQRLQMDGGVNRETAGACLEAGADVLVAASAIFRTPAYDQAIGELRNGPSLKKAMERKAT